MSLVQRRAVPFDSHVPRRKPFGRLHCANAMSAPPIPRPVSAGSTQSWSTHPCRASLRPGRGPSTCRRGSMGARRAVGGRLDQAVGVLAARPTLRGQQLSPRVIYRSHPLADASLKAPGKSLGGRSAVRRPLGIEPPRRRNGETHPAPGAGARDRGTCPVADAALSPGLPFRRAMRVRRRRQRRCSQPVLTGSPPQ
jgi:hypothetical protein